MKVVRLSIAALLILSCATMAQAYTIGGGAIDVGSIDTLLGQTVSVKKASGRSNDAKEAAWVSDILGFDVTFESKNDAVASDMVSVDGADSLFALDFGSGDNNFYYLIKTGNGSADGSRVFLFGNEIGMDWAVVDLLAMGFGDKIGVSKLSHLTTFSGGATSVPESGTVILFVVGLLCLVVTRRSQQA